MARGQAAIGAGVVAIAAVVGLLPARDEMGATRPAVVSPVAPTSPSPNPIYFDADNVSIGDPNPIYENGVYSVFYLRNVGRHPLWISQSADLARWSKPRETVASGGEGSPDFWVGSGSMVADPAGGYRLFYTGHNPERQVTQVVMSARANSLAGPWRKDRAITLSGSQDYSKVDFRDPYVLWNPEKKSYWMLVTTRTRDRAAIGLYVSSNLNTWSEKPPLYTAASPLNLEVPDLFADHGKWYLVYSDQRETFRQVRYLSAPQSTGPYHASSFDALDGAAFYAGKSAGPGAKRLLFGWIAHKQGHKDDGAFQWGGDLVFHALRSTAHDGLAVSLPSSIRKQFDRHLLDLSGSQANIGAARNPLLVSLRVPARPGNWLDLRFSEPGSASTLHFDMGTCRASFLFNDRSDKAPAIAFPCRKNGTYKLDLVTDPYVGIGIAYIDDFRALSFRYYGLAKSKIALISNNPATVFEGSVSGTDWGAYILK